PWVRSAALHAIKALRVPESMPAALDALDSPHAEGRREAVGVLSYLKLPETLGALTRMAVHDEDTDVRRAAVGALGFATGATDVNVQPTLSRALTDTAWQVREEAAGTMGKLNLVLGASSLITAMEDGYWQVRVKAARSLGRLRATDALPSLSAALDHPISNLRKEAVIALGELRDTRAMPALERALGDADPDVRKLAKLALAQLRMPEQGALS